MKGSLNKLHKGIGIDQWGRINFVFIITRIICKQFRYTYDDIGTSENT